MFRNIRISQELRKYFDAIDQGIKPRYKRSPKCLPNDFDDNPKCYQRTWKKYRKTKYKTPTKTM